MCLHSTLRPVVSTRLRKQPQPPVDDLCYLSLLYESRKTACFNSQFNCFSEIAFDRNILLITTRIVEQITHRK